MHTARQIFMGLGIAILSLVITLGGLATTLTEGNLTAASQTPSPTETPVHLSNTPLPATPTSLSPSSTPTPTPSPTSCPLPDGWNVYVLQVGDTLEGLALLYGISENGLTQANCLGTSSLLPGSRLYLPPLPTSTPSPTQIHASTHTPIHCGPPRGWVQYTIKAKDTLYGLSRAYGITVQQLQDANCMGSNITILIGEILYVPPWATRTPSPTFYLPPMDTFTPLPPEDTVTPDPTETFVESPTTVP